MTNGLFSLFSSLIANTPPYRKGLPSRKFLSLFLILFFAVGNAWAQETVTVDLALAKNSDPSPSIGEIIGTNYKNGSFDGTGYKIGSDNNSIGWNIASSGKTFTSVSFEGYINSSSTDKNWGFKFSTDGGTTWGAELTQANDGKKEYHSINVTVAITEGANAIQIIRKAGTSTYVKSITLTLAPDAGGDPVPVTGISISPSPASVKVGKTITLTPTITPSNATDKDVTWAVTSGETYASVGETTGVVTGLAEGTATITATAHDGSGVTQTVTVNVEECPTSGTVFSMVVTAPAGTQYEENNDFGLEIGATYSGGKAYSGSKSTTKRIGEIDTNGEYSFNKNSDVAVKVALDCALQEGDVIIFTTSTKRELKIKKVVGTDLVTTSSKKYTIPAESPLIGEYDFYLMRDNSESTFKTLKVERPYTISFDMQGHGDAIEAQKLIAGDKVVEPTAPTADGWDFKGWYKESACTNAWDFENDIVAGTMALYAKWDVHVTNDATLKSLKYGSEAIALADGVFEYNIGLPALTASVPTLTAVANSATVHSLDIVDADAFDVDGKATSTVTVVSEDETVTNVYTVNFSKMAELPQVNVTESTTWNFSAGGSTTLTNQSDIVLANLPGINNDANFNSQALIGSFNKLEGTYFQGSQLSFTTEVAGELTITFRGTNNNERHLQVCVGDGETVVADWNYQGSGESAQQTQSVIVPAGKVILKAFEGEVAQNARVYNMIFDATPDYIRTGLTVGSLGTICLPSNVPAGYAFGATFYKLVGKEPQYGKIVFDEILSGELEAGKPYLFQAQSDVLYCFYGTESVSDPDNSGAMKGTFEDMTLTDLTNIYYFAQKALWSCVDLSSLSVPANRAYVKMDEMPAITESNPAPGVRRITLGVNGQQVATGVDQVQGDEVPTKMIINGQLFILRGEKMYDAQGKLVK